MGQQWGHRNVNPSPNLNLTLWSQGVNMTVVGRPTCCSIPTWCTVLDNYWPCRPTCCSIPTWCTVLDYYWPCHIYVLKHTTTGDSMARSEGPLCVICYGIYIENHYWTSIQMLTRCIQKHSTGYLDICFPKIGSHTLPFAYQVTERVQCNMKCQSREPDPTPPLTTHSWPYSQTDRSRL